MDTDSKNWYQISDSELASAHAVAREVMSRGPDAVRSSDEDRDFYARRAGRDLRPRGWV